MVYTDATVQLARLFPSTEITNSKLTVCTVCFNSAARKSAFKKRDKGEGKTEARAAEKKQESPHHRGMHVTGIGRKRKEAGGERKRRVAVLASKRKTTADLATAGRRGWTVTSG